MDALFRKVKKTPSHASKGDSAAVRHEKLGEGWAENKQPVAEDDGVVFYLKYLGFTLVEEVDDDESYGDGASAKAVQRIVAMAKSEGKKLQKVALKVCCKGIQMVDITTNQQLYDTSIYRISFCTADKTHDKVFAFIARNTINETMQCHAFLCAKTKIAQAVTLTVWQAFNVAQDRWRDQQNKKSLRGKDKGNIIQQQHQISSQLPSNQTTHSTTNLMQTPALPVSHRPIISIPPPSSSPFQDSFADYKPTEIRVGNGEHRDNKMIQDEDDENLEDSFSKLAETRGRGRIPSFSTDLRQEDVDDGVQQYMDGQRCFEEFSRQKSIEDLLSL
ncbi:low density lipoprotein receptor adapter protein 1-like [Littorina saxatilis]|uniref:PID domain-containing protein n=1 Tax=Littorina saxatilis TaxID=31220 RepID=A0AAN9GGA7_9CAEN